MRRLKNILFALILILTITPHVTRADATIEVNTAVDENGTGSDCSLREAITAANTNADFGGCVGGGGAYSTDTITFNSTVFSTAQTITLTSALPNITSSMTITGPGADLLTVSGNNLFRPFRMSNAFVFMSNMTVTQGRQVGDNGGNIYVYDGQVTLDNMVVSQGYSSLNGGGAAVQFGDLNVRNSIFSNNTAGIRGGGISVHSGASDLVQITGSTFTGNSAAEGGAISNLFGIVLSNSTFSGNSATTAGGAIWSSNGGGGIVNVTISGNSSSGSGSGVYISGNMTIINTIIANNTGAAVNCFGSPTIGNSLISDGSCGIVNGVAGNIIADPLLSPLADNGGTTPTMAIGPDSPARNAGNNFYLSEELSHFNYNGDADPDDSLTTDQRGSGFNRVVFGTVDMGAFENSTPSTNFIVDTVSDLKLSGCTALPNDCSLRGVISVANYLAGTDTITFSPAVFSTPQTITLTSALPSITSDLSIIGPGTDLLTISGNDLYRPFTIQNFTTVTISDLTVVDSYYAGSGGSISNSGTLRVVNVAFHENNATFNGGVIDNMGTAYFINTTFNGNTASVGGGAISTYLGIVIVVNSTFFGNTAATGGAIVVSGGLTMINSTVKGNSATTGGGIYRYPAASATIYNSILADNSNGGNCGNISAGADNLSTDATCTGFAVVTSQQLNLAPVAKNGGPTLNFEPLPGSIAIDAGNNVSLDEANLSWDINGDNDYNDSITTDQRGLSRVMFNAVDVGAVESQVQITGLVVDTTSDSDLEYCTDQPNDCSLRGAITVANLLTGADLITFDSTLFSTPQTITLTDHMPTITTPITITGAGMNLLTLNGNNLYRPLRVLGAQNVVISDLTLSQGKDLNSPVAGLGGNMLMTSSSVTLAHMKFDQGTAANGGAIYALDSITRMNDSTFSGNSASASGGAIQNTGVSQMSMTNNTFTDNEAATGGAVVNDGTLFIANSTFTQNEAATGGAISNTNTVIIANSTLSGNHSTITGGAIYQTGTQATLVNVTISNNTNDNTNNPNATAGSGIDALDKPLTLVNSIVANNSAATHECNGTAVMVSHSLIEDGSCGITNGVNGNLTGDPLLSPLANNGGPTQTMALQPGSTALDAGDANYLVENIAGVDFNGDGDTNDRLTTDQRGAGFRRVINANVDMGAYEISLISSVDAVPVLNYSATDSTTLTWNRVTWATGYEVQIAASTDFANLLCGGTITLGQSNLSMTTCTLERGTYYWHVRGIPASGTGAWSLPIAFVIDAP